jgi:hypothetical protein
LTFFSRPNGAIHVDIARHFSVLFGIETHLRIEAVSGW